MAWWNNETEVAEPTMADLRTDAQREYADGSRYGIRPEGYESYGDMDWLGGRDVRPTWTEEDQLRINQIEAEQQMYNQDMGTPYLGGPLQDPRFETMYPPPAAYMPPMDPVYERFITNAPSGRPDYSIGSFMDARDSDRINGNFSGSKPNTDWFSERYSNPTYGFNRPTYDPTAETLPVLDPSDFVKSPLAAPVQTINTYNPDPSFQVTSRPVSAEDVPMIRYSPTSVPSGDVPVDNWWKINASF